MTSPDRTGLSSSEAEKRLAEFGLNQVSKPYEVNFLDIAKEEVTEPMILLLFVVGFFYSIWGKIEDALTILIVILVLVFVEIWNEYRAKKAISALSKIASPTTKVYRDGEVKEVLTEQIVPGDILLLTPGTRVAADGKTTESFNLLEDESHLTGESFPQEKEKGDEVYAGSLILSGEGKAEVSATGKNTRIGKISSLAQEIKPPKTPLQLAMRDLAGKLVWVAVFFSVLIPLLGFLRGQDLQQMILTGLALAFAVIPEELPIVITMVLGLGSYKLSHENFLVKKLKAVEVLGNTTVIVTDKTGTITENKMRVVSVLPEEREKEVMKAAWEALTELSLAPTDKAITDKATELGLATDQGELVRERSFGDHKKTKSVVRRMKDKLELVVTGAPEEILPLSKNDKGRINSLLEGEAAKGRRVIAVAHRFLSSGELKVPFSEIEKNLDFLGIVSLEDPPRKEVATTIGQVTRAGIRTVVVTGDHPLTASYIAKSVGIPSEKVLTGDDLDRLSDDELRKAVEEVSVFARTAPEHKYRLVKALRENGEVVAVTGDGVNDTLALKGADIGVAMGIKGTDAAKEAADVVLADDNYVTIGHGIFEGRKLFDNLTKGIKYYLSVKVALVLIFLLPALLNIPLPFSPVQIIVLELFMDLAASAGFVAEPAEKTIYSRPPRDPKEKFLNSRMIRGILVSGLSLCVAVVAAYTYAVYLNAMQIQLQTIAFTTWMIAHILLAFVSRSEKEPLYSLGLLSNHLMDLWALGVAIFLILGLTVPSIGLNLRLTSLTLVQIGIVIAISFVTTFWQELGKIFAT